MRNNKLSLAIEKEQSGSYKSEVWWPIVITVNLWIKHDIFQWKWKISIFFYLFIKIKIFEIKFKLIWKVKAKTVSIWNNENIYLQIISTSENHLMISLNELLKLAFKMSKFILKELYMKTYCLTETTFEYESKNWEWKENCCQ